MSGELFHEDEQLSEVLQQISNQLRLSLGNIYPALEQLVPPNVRDQDEKIDQKAAILYQSFYRILRLTNNISDAAEPERPAGMGLNNDDIVKLCRDVIDRAQAPAEMLGIKLEFRCVKTGHIIAMDRDRIERLLLNLLSNSFKFIGSGEKRVSLEVQIERDYVYLVLTDTGSGIPPEILDSVFDRARQIGRMDPSPHGLGLGLPLCQRIAQEHEGRLALFSEVGKGTVVKVSLPNRHGPIIVNQDVNSFGGFNKTLLELSDALPKQAYTRKYLD